MVLGKLPVPGRPTYLDYNRERPFCACSRCGWGLFGHFYAPPQKVAGYYVIPSELLSVCPSVCPSVRPSVRQRLNIRVRSITLIPFEINSRNLVQM